MRKKAKQDLGFVAWVRSTYAPNDAQKALTAFEALSSAASESNPARVRAGLKGAEHSLVKRLSKRTAAVYASRFRTAYDRWVAAHGGREDALKAPEESPRIDARSFGEAYDNPALEPRAKYIGPRQAIETVEETAPIEGDVLLQAAQLLDESNRWPALQPYLVPFVANLIRKSRG